MLDNRRWGADLSPNTAPKIAPKIAPNREGPAMTALIHVALGGALGASLRYLGVAAIYRLTGPAFPYGTMAVNLVGCLAMGALLGWLGPRTSAAPFLLTGVLGGFTTFSAFSADALRLVERGAMGAALIYVAVTLAGALAACALGYVTLKAITA